MVEFLIYSITLYDITTFVLVFFSRADIINFKEITTTSSITYGVSYSFQTHEYELI